MTLINDVLTYSIQALNWIYSSGVSVLKAMSGCAGAVLEVIGEIIDGLLD